MPVPVTALYAALLALLGVVLQQLVGFARLRAGVSLGDGGDGALLVAIRRQANFIEQVPLALLLMALIELNGASPFWLHLLGTALLFARILHPFGLETADMRRLPRFFGAVITLLVVLGAVGIALWQVI